jgi:hypothetical protein
MVRRGDTRVIERDNREPDYSLHSFEWCSAYSRLQLLSISLSSKEVTLKGQSRTWFELCEHYHLISSVQRFNLGELAGEEELQLD